jgi:hypothetical protein
MLWRYLRSGPPKSLLGSSRLRSRSRAPITLWFLNLGCEKEFHSKFNEKTVNTYLRLRRLFPRVWVAKQTPWRTRKTQCRMKRSGEGWNQPEGLNGCEISIEQKSDREMEAIGV